MKVNIIGFMKVEYNKKDEAHTLVKGTNIYVLEEIQSSYGSGQRPMMVGMGQNRRPDIWIPDKVMPFEQITTGEAELLFNQYGTVDAIKYI